MLQFWHALKLNSRIEPAFESAGQSIMMEAPWRLAAIAFLTVLAGDVFGGVIPPIGLAPGSQYQLIFTTAGTRDATSSDIDDYNTFVQNEAALSSSLPSTTWHAVGSTPDDPNAAVNAPQHGLPIYNTQGQLFADAGIDIYALPTSLVSPLSFDQHGNPTVPNFSIPENYHFLYSPHTEVTLVWTGGFVAGGVPQLSDEHPVYGAPEMVTLFGGASFMGLTPDQIDSVLLGGDFWPLLDSTEHLPLYALSDPITFVPEPATRTLVGIALLMFGAFGLRRPGWCRISIIAVVLVAISNAADAGTVTYSDALPFGNSLGVPQWDQAAYPGQELHSVTIDFQPEITVGGFFFNFNPNPTALFYSAFGDASLTLPNTQQLVAVAPLQTTSIVLPPSGGAFFVSIDLPASASLTYVNPTETALFIGNGFLSMPTSVDATGNGAGGPGIDFGLQDQISGGNSVSVTYEWTAVPEPSTAVLAIVVLAILGFAKLTCMIHVKSHAYQQPATGRKDVLQQGRHAWSKNEAT